METDDLRIIIRSLMVKKHMSAENKLMAFSFSDKMKSVLRISMLLNRSHIELNYGTASDTIMRPNFIASFFSLLQSRLCNTSFM